MAKKTSELDDKKVIDDIIDKIVTNISMLVDRDLKVESVTTSRAHERPSGRSTVHISFKLLFQNTKGGEGHGCILVPLPDALSLACYLMMFPEGEVKAHREDEVLDRSTKDAMLELANFIGAAVDESMRLHVPGTSVRSEGCQGVRADVRPNILYEEGTELLVARANTRVHEFPEFELIAMLPVLPLAA